MEKNGQRKFFIFISACQCCTKNQTRILYAYRFLLEMANVHTHTPLIFRILQQCKWIRYTNRALWSLICIIQVNKCDWMIIRATARMLTFFLVSTYTRCQVVLTSSGSLFYRIFFPLRPPSSFQFPYQFRIYYNPNIFNNLFNMCERIFR